MRPACWSCWRARIAAAEAGDAGAQYRLAVDHFLGTHPRANDGRALYWYRRAAEQGHVPAQLLLGQMYESGWGVASDRAQAIRWYRQAAASGDSGGREVFYAWIALYRWIFPGA